MNHCKGCWWEHRDCQCNTCQNDNWHDGVSCCQRMKQRGESCCVTDCPNYQAEAWETIMENADAEWIRYRAMDLSKKWNKWSKFHF